MSTHAPALTKQDPRYPVGKFEYTGPYSEAERRQFVEELAQLPAKLRAAVAGLNDQQLDTPYRDGGWTLRQTVHHVADSHMNSFIRFRLALTEDNPPVKPYDEKRWADLADMKEPVEFSLKILDALHHRWIVMLNSFNLADWKRTMQHPEWGTLDLDQALGLYAWHSRHHTAHITELRKRRGW